MKTNKKWKKPTLLILQKGGPEEACLTGCKTEKSLGIGPTLSSTVHGCSDNIAGNCDPCMARASSGS